MKPRLPAPTAELPRRAAVTAGAVLAFLVLERTPLPLLDPEALQLLATLADALPQVSVLALGLVPLVSASILVELFALAVPRLAARRHGTAEERAPLTAATWAVATALAAFQGFGVASYLQRIAGAYGEAVLPWGIGPALVVTATLVAATLSAGVAAVLVSRHGLGNGVAVLLGVVAVEGLVRTALRAVAAGGDFPQLAVLAVLALAVLAPLALRHRRPPEGPRVPFPTSGLALVQAPPALVALLATLGAWVAAPASLAEALDGTLLGDALQIAIAAILAPVLSRLFCPAAEVAAAYERAVPGRHPDADVRSAVSAAHRRAFLLAVAVSAVPLAMVELTFPFVLTVEAVFTAAVALAVALDLAEEIRARRAHGPLVPARAVHRLFAVPPALEALAEAGLPAVARARRYRALFWFFAPYAPVELLVPPARAAEAEAICARVVAG